MIDCVICQGAGRVRLPVYKKLSMAFDANAAISLDPIEDSFRTYACPECSGEQATEEKVSIVYAESTLSGGRVLGTEPGLMEAVARDLARATAEKLLRDGLIEIKSEKRGEDTLFYSKLGAVSPRAVQRLEARAFDKMKEMLGNVLTRAMESIAVWGSHYSGSEGMISKGQAIDYVDAAFRRHLQDTAAKLGSKSG